MSKLSISKILTTSFVILSTLFITKEALALPKLEFNTDDDLEIYQQVQAWNVTTLGSGSTGTRNDTYIRRGRIGTKGHLFKKLFFFNALFDYDNLGKDGKTGTLGTAQATGNTTFEVHEAFFTMEFDPRLNFTFGYLKPQIGRENLSSDFDNLSFESSYTSSYLRIHILGRGSGRETGVNLGGIQLGQMWSLIYNLGIFDTNHEKITGGTADSKNGSNIWSPLLTGRLSFTLGSPEFDKYKLGNNYNYFGKRNGISLGASFSYHGSTDIFKSNNLIGVDLLANFQNFIFTAEFDQLGRQLNDSYYYADQVLHGKVSYNIDLPNEYILEPSFMYSQSFVDTKSAGGLPSERMLDAGLNWYINKNNFKVMAHFIQRQDTKDEKKSSGYIGLACQLLY